MHTVLSVLVRVASPLLPLLSEEIYGGLHSADAGATSVHLTDWPSLDDLPADDDLVDTMDLVRDVCSATLSVRKAHQRRVRLPLNSVTVASVDAERLGDFVDVIADEVNVRNVELTTDVASVATERLQLVPAKLGPRLGKDVQQVIKAHKAGDWTVDGDDVVVGGVLLEPGEYSLELVASGDQASTGLGSHAGVIALDIDVTEELEVEGRARDLVRLVQQARREADLDVSDRIELSVSAGDEWIDAIEAHRDLIAGETLATSVETYRLAGAEGTEPAITVTVAR
jgi:isoleucyl-tRNA synthetase